ncbi:MAG: hypothetical protein WBG92_03200 [Thiohalocapsa sp.]
MCTLTSPISISNSGPEDWAALASLYRQAFPEEDLLPLVRSLLHEVSGVLSLLATLDATVVGHGLFTPCDIVGRTGKAALLGPRSASRPGFGDRAWGARLSTRACIGSKLSA